MSALANNTEPETALAKAAAPETITVGKVKKFNNDQSVIVQGVTDGDKIAEFKVWECNAISDIHVGTKLINLKNTSDTTDDPNTKEFDSNKVRLWNTKGYPVAGGGLWKCQSAEVDPTGPHYQTCFAGIQQNQPGIFCGKVEMIDTDTVSLPSGDSFEKTIFTITGTEGSECKFSITSSAETKSVSVGDMVAFFAVDQGFAPNLDAVSYVKSIKVISDTTNTGSEEMTPKEETTTTTETTTPTEETTKTTKEETTTPKETVVPAETIPTKDTTPKEETTTTPKEETTTTKETVVPAETTPTKDTTTKEKVLELEEAVGVKRQMNDDDSPPLSSIKRSKSMAQ